ncbi:hypothetical protein TNCV_2276291 [Trichonephila clavipes]|nr:hypothetical protein TNCV_2276291 [Trichonephila clavipes]
MPSPVQSNCDAHDTIANGQYGVVWSMGHTQQVCVRIVLLLSNVWQQFFGRSAFVRQQETDLPSEVPSAKRTRKTAKSAESVFWTCELSRLGGESVMEATHFNSNSL